MPAGLLRGIRSRAKRTNDARVLILGLDNAGKTTILKKMTGEESDGTPEGPTQGFNLKSMNYNGREAKFCDLGGQRTFREFWQDYYESTDALVFVVDSTDSRRLEEAEETFRDVLANVPKIPVLVFANKQDLATAKSPAYIAEALKLTEYTERKWQIQGCSAKSDENNGLAEGMQWVMNSTEPQ